MQHNLTADTQHSELTVRGGGRYQGQYMLRIAVLSLAILLFLTAGVAIASTNAGPDSFLYPVKRSLEGMRTSLMFDPADRAGAETSHADARLDEIGMMVEAGKPEYVPLLLASYEEHMENARRSMDEAAAQGVDTRDIEARINAASKKHDVVLIDHADELLEFAESDVIAAMGNSQYLGTESWQRSRDPVPDDAGTTGRSSVGDTNGQAGSQGTVASGSGQGNGSPANVNGQANGQGNGGGQGNAGGQGNGNSQGNGIGQSNGNGQGNGGGQGNAGGQGNGGGQGNAGGQGNGLGNGGSQAQANPNR